MPSNVSLENYLADLGIESLRKALETFQLEQGAFDKIIVASENHQRIELIVSGLSEDKNWSGGAVQYFINKKTLKVSQGWHEHTSPLRLDDSDLGVIKLIDGVSVYLHFAGIRLMNSAKNTITKERDFIVQLNDLLVYQFSVRPAESRLSTHRIKMADYKKVELEGTGRYKLEVFDPTSSNITTHMVTIEQPLWIHLNYVIYPDNHPLAQSEGITIDIFNSPQIYR